MSRLCLFLLLLLALLSPRVGAEAPASSAAQAAGFEQKLGAMLPLNAEFQDENGRTVRLGQFFGEKPVVLVLAYYDCPSLCTLVLNGLLESVRELRLEAQRDFQIVVVSIRPDQSPALARAKKQTYVTRYGRHGTAEGWHFLAGAAGPIQELAESAGFHYSYDAATDQFAHASGIVIASPAGKISRYFLGIEYPAGELRRALTEAAQNRTGTLAEKLLLLCFRYDAHSGRYTLAITRLLQLAGIGTVLALGLFILRAHRARGAAAPTLPPG